MPDPRDGVDTKAAAAATAAARRAVKLLIQTKAGSILLLILTAFCIGLRLLSRSMRKPQITPRRSAFWWDDWTALVAAMLSLALSGVYIALGHFMLDDGLLYEKDPRKLTPFLKCLYVSYFLSDFGLFFAKMSALLFLSRALPHHANSSWFNYAVYITHVLNCLWLVGVVVTTLLQCQPIAKNWDVMMPGTVLSMDKIWKSSSITNALIDLIILILPLPKIWRLRMGTGRKIGTLVVFVLGYSVVVMSVGRLVVILQAGTALDVDFLSTIFEIGAWTAGELPVAVIGICVPGMLPLGHYLVKKLLPPRKTKATERNFKVASDSSKESGSINNDPTNELYLDHIRISPISLSPNMYEESLNSAGESNVRDVLAPDEAYRAISTARSTEQAEEMHTISSKSLMHPNSAIGGRC